MFEAGPPTALTIGLAMACFIGSAVFLGAVRKEKPEKLDEYDDPDMLSLSIGPLYVPFVAVMSLDYESWDLSRTTIWIGRTLFTIFAAMIAVILWELISLA